jgi:hypothetical protein
MMKTSSSLNNSKQVVTIATSQHAEQNIAADDSVPGPNKAVLCVSITAACNSFEQLMAG